MNENHPLVGSKSVGGELPAGTKDRHGVSMPPELMSRELKHKVSG
jgi:hypothetical protein